MTSVGLYDAGCRFVNLDNGHFGGRDLAGILLETFCRYKQIPTLVRLNIEGPAADKISTQSQFGYKN